MNRTITAPQTSRERKQSQKKQKKQNANAILKNELVNSGISLVAFFLLMIGGYNWVTASVATSPATASVATSPATSYDITTLPVETSNSVRVYNYDTDKYEMVSRGMFGTNDVICLAKLSVLRDLLIDRLGATYGSSELLREATQIQDNIILKYSVTVPTIMIDEEKVRFIASIPQYSVTEWLHSQYQPCGLNTALLNE